MSVLSSFPAMPNRIAITCEYLWYLGANGANRETVESQLSPKVKEAKEEGQVGSTISKDVITEMMNLKLLESLENGNMALTEELRNINPSPDDWQKTLRPILRQKMLYLDQAESFKQSELPDALAWLLTQDPFTPLLRSKGQHVENINTQLEENDPLRLAIANDSRWQNLLYWGRYFGCVEWLEIGNNKFVIPDPSEAIILQLPIIFVAETELPISKFIEQLGQACPVLESGEARENLEARILDKFKRQSEHLSRSTSLALKRLELRGIIKTKAISDAKSWILDLGEKIAPISHIEMIKKEVA
jgi:hypothetical protein